MSKDFTQYDYESLVDEATQKLSDQPGWGQGYQSSMGQTLIQLLADITDNLQFMLERRTQESYLITSRLDSSARAAVSAIGYRPRRKISATGQLKLRLKDNQTDASVPAIGNIFIPYGTEVYFEDNAFIVMEDATIASGDSEVTLSVKEGSIRQETFNFEASPYRENNFLEFSDYVNKEEFSLYIQDAKGEFYDVDNEINGIRLGALSFADSKTRAYDIRYYRSGMRIIFGNDIFGKKPEGEVVVNWVESSGSEVDVVKTGLEFNFASEYLYDDTTTTPRNIYYYELTNTTPIRGGNDEESIVEMRRNVAEYVRTNDRAVTNFDYEFWTRRSGIGDIVDVTAYGEHEADTIIFTMNNVYIAYLTKQGIPLNAVQKTQLGEYLSKYKVNTTHLVISEAVRTYLKLDIDFKRHPKLPISDAQLVKILKDRINEYFGIREGAIGTGFQHSEFVEYLQNLTTVFNNITYPMTDFVKVEIDAMIPLPIPQPAYDGIVELSYDYVINKDDIWNVTINGNTYSILVYDTDTVETLVARMKDKIFQNTSLMLATPKANQIRIKEPTETGTYTLSVGTGDLVEFTRFRQLIQLPKSQNVATSNSDQIKPNSVRIVDDQETIIMQDDGNGNVEPTDGYFFPVVFVDYKRSLIEAPSVPNGMYYVKFQQNEYQNFDVARDGAVFKMPFADEPTNTQTSNYSVLNIIR